LMSILTILQRDYIWSKLTGVEIVAEHPQPVVELVEVDTPISGNSKLG
jgi:hypothetical protein